MWLYDRANASIHAALRAKRTLRRLDPMGEKKNQPFQLSVNPCLKGDFQGSRVTYDGGLLLVRESNRRLGLSALIAASVGFGIKTCRRGSTSPGAPGKEQTHGRSKAGPQQ